MPSLNHMFIPTGGGLDLQSVLKAQEEDCIIMCAGGAYFLVKPKMLILENINKDFLWSYFRLELQQLMPIGEECPIKSREMLTEDLPGHYISPICGNYGYYEDGTKLPDNYRVIDRFLEGTFVFFSKTSIYNRISGTYDARHNIMNTVQFRNYIEKMREDYIKLGDFKLFRNLYNRNPFKSTELYDLDLLLAIEQENEFKEFVYNNYKKWDFSELCKKYNHSIKVNELFSIEVRLNTTNTIRGYISTEGRIEEIPHFLYPRMEKSFLVKIFDDTLLLIKDIENMIERECNKSEIQWVKDVISYSIKIHRIGYPKHLFTKDEIKEVLKNGNDEKNNVLVIDSNGYAKLIESPKKYELYRYPVRHEGYNAFNNYVGKYSSLNHLNDEYISSLEGWLEYLENGEAVYIDYIKNELDELELLEKITRYYK